ncbi:hypothetical protein CFOL_v3_24579, partial [Cephalotus follicularis]
IEKHPHPYKISWFRKGNEVSVTSQCLVKFTIGDNLEDEALCDIVPMDACHVLLDRPWLYDHDMVQCTKPNTYSFQRAKKTYTLHPLKEEISKPHNESSVNGFLINKVAAGKFEVKSKEVGVMYALVGNIVTKDQFMEFDRYPLEV